MILHLVVGETDHEVHIEPGDRHGEYRVVVDGEPFDARLARDGSKVRCELGDERHVVERRVRTVLLDGEQVLVGIRGLAQAGFDHSAHATGEVRPPMPGRILDVRVKVGDVVERGQTLVVLEAMKMQNEIGSPGKGRVAEVRAQKGATVESKDVLVVLEPV